MARQHMSEIAGRLFPASFVGSYPRPSWYNYNLGSRDVLEAMRDEDFADAYRDGIRAIIGDQEEVGLDVLVDGHLWYDKHQGFIGSFALYNAERFEGTESRLSGGRMMEVVAETQQAGPEEWEGMMEVFDSINSVQIAIVDRLGRGPLRHAHNWRLAQRCTDKPVKAMFAMGPVELSMIMVDEHYRDRRPLLRDLGELYRAEMLEAVAAGAKVVELDDLIFLAPEDEWAFDVEILNSVFDGVDAYRIWHCCHGGTPAPIGMAPYEAMFPVVKELQVESFDWSFAQDGFRDEVLELFATPGFEADLGLGVISNKNYLIETPTEVANGIRKALRHVAPERIHLTSDCGLFAYARPAAKAKLKAMVKGAELIRGEVAS
jgi:5-methyltetrahydropteroyltriglutamate--homocysteine methyltransferase